MEENRERVYLTKNYTGVPRGAVERPDLSVALVDRETGLQTPLVESDGSICGFPGVEYSDELRRVLGERVLRPVIRYEAVFEKLGDGFIMVWTVQPDGRYWGEDGFGDEDEPAVALYACLDARGRFTWPFRLYRVGYQFYTGHRLSYYLP